MPKKFTRIGAYGLFVEDGRILLCRLSSIESNVGKWTLPGGGVEFGETPQDAARREIMEETGLDAKLDEMASVDSKLCEFSDGTTMHFVRIVFRARQTGGTLRNELDGSTDLCQWFTEEEARSTPLVDLAEFGVELAFGS